MATQLEVPFKHTVHSAKSPEDTLAYLQNYPESVGKNLEELQEFKEIEPGVFLWGFESFKFKSLELKIEFATRFDCETPLKIRISPIQGGYTSWLKGDWTLQPSDGGTDIIFDVNFLIEAPVPRLVKAVVVPFARRELTHLLERFMVNVGKALNQ